MWREYCGFFAPDPESLKSWRVELQAQGFDVMEAPGTSACLQFMLSGHGSQQFVNDEHTLATMVGAPYRLNAESSVSEPLTLAAIVSMVRKSGPRALAEIGGPFALAIATPATRELLLAIDRFAVHNLYYVAERDSWAFATRAPTLSAHPSVARRFHAQAIYDYLYFHCLPAPDAGFINMERVLPGHFVQFTGGKRSTHAYWAPQYHENAENSFGAQVRALPSIIETAVSRRQSETETACFLSGGLDSSTVTGLCAKRAPGKVTAFTIGFDASGYDEMEFARSVAEHFKVKHAHYYVTPQDIIDSLPAIIGALDAPLGNASTVPTYFCARLAAQHGFQSIMAGDGGDELFGGNSRYATQILFDYYRRMPALIRRGLAEPAANGLPTWARRGLIGKAASYIRQAAVPLPDRLMTYNLLNHIPPQDFLTPEFAHSLDLAHPLARLREMYVAQPDISMINQLLRLDWRLTLADNDLPKVSRMSALAGLEVHYPMLDEGVFEFAAHLPASAKVTARELRPLFRTAFAHFLPQSTLTKSKQGFGMPFGVWLNENASLKEFASEHLRTLEKAGLIQSSFRHKFLSGTLQMHPAYFGMLIWILMALGLWLTTHRAEVG